MLKPINPAPFLSPLNQVLNWSMACNIITKKKSHKFGSPQYPPDGGIYPLMRKWTQAWPMFCAKVNASEGEGATNLFNIHADPPQRYHVSTWRCKLAICNILARSNANSLSLSQYPCTALSTLEVIRAYINET